MKIFHGKWTTSIILPFWLICLCLCISKFDNVVGTKVGLETIFGFGEGEDTVASISLWDGLLDLMSEILVFLSKVVNVGLTDEGPELIGKYLGFIAN